MLAVTLEIPLCILSGIPDESEAHVVQNGRSPNKEAFEMAKNYVGDKELDELIFRQFLQPHSSNLLEHV